MLTIKDIKAGILQLDPENPNHWLVDGTPKLEAVRFILKDPSITREQVQEAHKLAPEAPVVTAEDPPVSADQPQEEVKDTEQSLEDMAKSLFKTREVLDAKIFELTKQRSEVNKQLEEVEALIEKADKPSLQEVIHAFLDAQHAERLAGLEPTPNYNSAPPGRF